MTASPIRVVPRAHDAHDIVYFERRAGDLAPSSPGRDALNSWPSSVRATVRAVLIAVAAAPPYRYSGGGYWEAMHGDMAGIYEIRVDGPGRRHYRLFCVVDSKAKETAKPYLTVIGGLEKPFKSVFSVADYAYIRALRDEYLSKNPRSLTG